MGGFGVENMGMGGMSGYSPASRDHYHNCSPLPNAVDQPMPMHSQRSANAMAPVKAAGDVSLNGVQLVAFLVKALSLLPNVSAPLYS